MTHRHHDHAHHYGHRHHQHHAHAHGSDAVPGKEASREEDVGSSLSTKEKLAKMLDHWAHHNQDHVTSYRQWAQRARAEGLHTVADTLETVAQKSSELTELLEKAKTHLAS